MKVYNSTTELKKELKDQKVGLTIGNFDGVHKGHQSLIQSALEFCNKEGLTLVVLSFHPHPKELFLEPFKNFYLTDSLQKREKLAELGVEYFCELKFDQSLAKKTSLEFLEKDLLNHLDLNHLVLGYDFKFGSDKNESIENCVSFCKNHNIKLDIVDAYKLDENIVSSSLIRDLISQGEIKKANELLGNSFTLQGKVVSGKARGKSLGFPTANLEINPKRIAPCSGVYQTCVSVDGKSYNAITNVGNNPTFEDIHEKVIETHIFDFDQDIYNQGISLSFMRKIRNEKKFSNPDELILQIQKDIEEVKRTPLC